MDEFYEESELVREWKDEAMAKGLAEGEAKGLAESIEGYVQARFPSLVQLLHQRLQEPFTAEQLKQVQACLFASNTTEQALNCLNQLRQQ